MILKSILKISIAIPLLMATNLHAQSEVNLDSDDKKYSYAVGSRIGQQLLGQFSRQPEIDLDVLLNALNTTISGGESQMNDEEVANAINQQQQKALAAQAEAAAAKQQAGLGYLAENRIKQGVTETESGLQYSVITSGDPSGPSPDENDTAVVHYQGTLVDGTKFDSSYDRGQPASFSLTSIIPGWQEVLKLMKPGDKWAVVLPSDLAYGAQGAGGNIGPNETLLFDIELLEVKKSDN